MKALLPLLALAATSAAADVSTLAHSHMQAPGWTGPMLLLVATVTVAPVTRRVNMRGRA
ncbi:hypothetical protein [Alterinioella nitratireducens]|uniref:hypothetical protein n=1 Tax=Alterinioella nitratireducens TaxID=2735915 RepID=UPI0040590FDA